MNEVKFILTADEQRAVQGFLAVARAEGAAESGAKRAGKEIREVGNVVDQVNKTFYASSGEVARYFQEMSRQADAAHAKMQKAQVAARLTRAAMRAEPARLRGYDTTDPAEVARARGERAAEIRTERAARRMRDTEQASLRLSRAVAQAHGQIVAERNDRELADQRRMFARMEQEFERHRARMERREARYVEPARLAGNVDLDDPGAVAAYRRRRAAELRAARADDRQYTGQREREAANVLRRGRLRRVRQLRSEAAFRTVESGAGVALAGVTAIGQAVGNYTDYLDGIGAAGTEFRDQTRGLVSVEGNPRRSRAVKQNVLDLSGAYGLDRGDVANAIFNLQSGTANLDKNTQGRLLSSAGSITSVAGGSLDENLTALIKTWQIYGKEIGSVDKLQAKLFKTAEDGYLSFQDLAQLLPDVLPAAKAMGNSFDDVAAALVTATQAGGKNEKTFTAVRNIFLRMNQAEKEGVRLTGDFTNKLHQLSQVDANLLKKIFGDEAISMISVLAQKSGEVAANLNAIRNVQGDLVTKRGVSIMAGDVTNFLTDTLKGADEGLKNAPAQRGMFDPSLLKADIESKAAQRGYALTSNPTAEAWDFTGVGKRLAPYLSDWLDPSYTDGYQAVGSTKGLGINVQIDELMKAGIGSRGKPGDPLKLIQAEAMKLAFGRYTNSAVYPGGNGPNGPEWTGLEDAQRFLSLRDQGYKISSGQYLQYRQLQANDPGGTSAEQYLSRFASSAGAPLSSAAAALSQAAAALNAAAANLGGKPPNAPASNQRPPSNGPNPGFRK